MNWRLAITCHLGQLSTQPAGKGLEWIGMKSSESSPYKDSLKNKFRIDVDTSSKRLWLKGLDNPQDWPAHTQGSVVIFMLFRSDRLLEKDWSGLLRTTILVVTSTTLSQSKASLPSPKTSAERRCDWSVNMIYSLPKACADHSFSLNNKVAVIYEIFSYDREKNT